jgi:hypothetical protein
MKGLHKNIWQYSTSRSESTARGDTAALVDQIGNALGDLIGYVLVDRMRNALVVLTGGH